MVIINCVLLVARVRVCAMLLLSCLLILAASELAHQEAVVIHLVLLVPRARTCTIRPNSTNLLYKNT